MTKKDITLKMWLKNKERFADFFNGALFNGKQIVNFKDLEEVDSESDKIDRDKDNVTTYIKRHRDIVMRWKKKVNLAILAIESQTKIDYTMPVRSMMYDAMSYDEQMKSIHFEKNAIRKRKGNYISTFGKRDSLYPVITVIFYYGDASWKDNLELYDMFKDIDKTLFDNVLKKYISNYKPNIIDVGKIEDVKQFKSDLQIALGMIKYKNNKNGIKEYVNNNKNQLENIDVDTVEAISVLMNMEQLDGYIPKVKKGERIDMCKALQDWCEENKEIGREEGMRCIIVNMIQKGLSTETICDLAQCEMEYVEELRESLV